jgi:hypothetical protein
MGSTIESNLLDSWFSKNFTRFLTMRDMQCSAPCEGYLCQITWFINSERFRIAVKNRVSEQNAVRHSCRIRCKWVLIFTCKLN